MNTVYPIKLYSRLRSLHFFLQFHSVNTVSRLLPFIKVIRPSYSPEMLKLLAGEIDQLLTTDAENIARGVYPVAVLKPEPITEHLRRMPLLLWDGLRLGLRRRLKKTKDFDGVDAETLAETPEYFRRNFHFQTDGYLSDESAELYDHQVELLFSGTAAAMRRLFIAPLKKALADAGRSTTGENLRFLEAGSGTGSATHFAALTFDQARITGVDLSDAYLRQAEKKWAHFAPRVEFVKADATKTEYKNESFDVIYSVFLMHELPREIRKQFISEAHRLLKPGGFFVYVDSLQLGQNSAFDGVLERFPVDFHEPFYTDYIKTPMQSLLSDFIQIESGHSFLSSFGVYKKGDA